MRVPGAVGRIRLAEKPGAERERERQYELAEADLSRASSIFQRFHAKPERSLKTQVTRARLLIAKDDYKRAESALDSVIITDSETHLLRSIVQMCRGQPMEGLRSFQEYVDTVPDGSQGPEFENNWPFYQRMVTRCRKPRP